MDISVECPLALELAERLRESRTELTKRWLERITARVSMDPYRVFPTQQLLDHIPLLLEGLADHIEDPAEEISTHLPVVAKAMELGELRLKQGFDAHEILKEYEILGGVLFSFMSEIADEIPKQCSRGELLACAQRLFRGISLIEQVTTSHYLRVLDERVRERENRLRSFNRTVSHELKNRIGTLQSAGHMLGEQLTPEQRQKMRTVVGRSTDDIKALLDKLTELSTIDEKIVRPDVPLRQAVAEVMRQLRELAEEKEVEVRVSDELPEVRVNAAAVELCLSNYLGNAIKYSDPRKEQRWAEVRGHLREQPDGSGAKEVVVEVRDNGLGVPEQSRTRLFERFFRATPETATAVSGTGLGLSIVRDTVETMGGSAWVEHHEDGTTFSFALPVKRASEPGPT